MTECTQADLLQHLLQLLDRLLLAWRAAHRDAERIVHCVLAVPGASRNLTSALEASTRWICQGIGRERALAKQGYGPPGSVSSAGNERAAELLSANMNHLTTNDD